MTGAPFSALSARARGSPSPGARSGVGFRGLPSAARITFYSASHESYPRLGRGLLVHISISQHAAASPMPPSRTTLPAHTTPFPPPPRPTTLEEDDNRLRATTIGLARKKRAQRAGEWVARWLCWWVGGPKGNGYSRVPLQTTLAERGGERVRGGVEIRAESRRDDRHRNSSKFKCNSRYEKIKARISSLVGSE